MNLSIATDFDGSTGKAEHALELISKAGFTHLHWCHQWCTDYLYSQSEFEQIAGWLNKFGLKLLDIHGSQGHEKYWCSTDEYERRAGVELVANRIRMMRQLNGTGAVMMHIPAIHAGFSPEQKAEVWRLVDSLRKSLDDLSPLLKECGTFIAVENMWQDTWEVINKILDEYPPELVGICYDSGHANSNTLKQMDFLDARKDRLMALHLHDNNGDGDQHQPPFYGNVDWTRLSKIIASSGYSREISFELSNHNVPTYMAEYSGGRQPDFANRRFLTDAYHRCARFASMIQSAKAGN